MLIKDIIKKQFITCDVTNTIYEISKKMTSYNIGFIPLYENNEIVGVVTDRDIVIRGLTNNINNISSIMSTDVITIDINLTTDEALDYMSYNHVKRLIVTENEECIGVISISDIIKHDFNNGNIINTIINIFSEETNNKNVEIDDYKL